MNILSDSLVPKSIRRAVVVMAVLIAGTLFGGEILREFLADFTAVYMPRGACMRWDPILIWWHALTEAALFICFMGIPAFLFFTIYTEMKLVVDSEYRGGVAAKAFEKFLEWFKYPSGMDWGVRIRTIGWHACGFILFCGLGHGMDLVSIWHAIPWMKAFNNTITLYFSVTCTREIIGHLPYFIRIMRQFFRGWQATGGQL